MKDRIRAQAFALGFDLVGFTTAAPPAHIAEFQHWLAAGHHGEMAYLARRATERCAPAQLLPGLRSIIVVAQNYQPCVTYVTKKRQISEQVARYALGGRDYHEEMGGKLDRLAGCIRDLGGAAKWYVDTGPILERELAQRAGLGWIGKHTNLINRQFGNWIFLGEVLTTLELPADLPAPGQCGTCQRCLKACPTGALVAPYQLDARRCISYLTIELKGSIPVELRPAIGQRIFGCDDCLEVCPWNRFAQPVVVPRPLPALPEMLAWTDRQFGDFFRGTPMQRLKRRGWLRNICVALGNRSDRAAIPALQRALVDPEPLIREHAAWALAQL